VRATLKNQPGVASYVVEKKGEQPGVATLKVDPSKFNLMETVAKLSDFKATARE
jgi:hypothetical protein